MGMGGFGPPPADALVTPVTFQVKRRRLRGILESFDVQEDGTRELSAEWIVGKRTWQRLQTEWKAAQFGKKKSQPKQTEHVILYIHGGWSFAFISKKNVQCHIQVPTMSEVPQRSGLYRSHWHNTLTLECFVSSPLNFCPLHCTQSA